MSDRIHALEQREIMIHTAAIRAAIYAARGLRCEHCLPPVVPCDCRPAAQPLGQVLHESGDTEGGAHDWRCHSWITDGAAQFLADCSHEMANTTVPLLDVCEPPNVEVRGDAPLYGAASRSTAGLCGAAAKGER